MIFTRWNVKPNGFSKMQDFNLRTGHNDKYDDPVDRTQFRPDSEQVRAFHLTGAGSNSTPIYDKEEPSNLVVAMRSGKLDKAEISQIMQSKSKKVQEDLKSLQLQTLEQQSDSKGSDQTQTV